MLVLGLDTGSHGAFVVLDQREKIKATYAFPDGERDQIFVNYLDNLRAIEKPTVAYVESVHAIYGSAAQSTFNFGRNFQLAIDGLLVSGIPIKYVVPRVWQKEIYQGAPQYIKKGTKNKRDNKRISCEIALKHFNVDHYLATSRSKKPHDGLVDASLIALYGLRNELKENKK